MVTKRRSPNQTAVGISLEAELLAEIDARAHSLGLSRSAYLVSLARRDLAEGGDLVLREIPPPYGAKLTPKTETGSARKALQALKAARAAHPKPAQ